MGEKGRNNIKKIKNILNDKKEKDNNDLDVLFLVDATQSMESYIEAAKQETKNISEQLKKEYPEMSFRYGYIFYRDPVDDNLDTHEVLGLTEDVDELQKKIGGIIAEGGGDFPEDWAGAYKLANEKISWRNGMKIIMHLADDGAHGKLFSPEDKHPEEESKLIDELKKTAKNDIEIFGFVIAEFCRNSFEQCAKIYRNSGGSFEILDYFPPEVKNNPDFDILMNNNKSYYNINELDYDYHMNDNYNYCNNMNNNDFYYKDFQCMNNDVFNRNCVSNVSKVIKTKKYKKNIK